jgi:hypothetical protein
MHKALPCINHVSASHRYEHDGQRKRVAHMPTAATTEAASRFTIGLKTPTRLRDEAKNITCSPKSAAIRRRAPTLPLKKILMWPTRQTGNAGAYFTLYNS